MVKFLSNVTKVVIRNVAMKQPQVVGVSTLNMHQQNHNLMKKTNVAFFSDKKKSKNHSDNEEKLEKKFILDDLEDDQEEYDLKEKFHFLQNTDEVEEDGSDDVLEDENEDELDGDIFAELDDIDSNEEEDAVKYSNGLVDDRLPVEFESASDEDLDDGDFSEQSGSIEEKLSWFPEQGHVPGTPILPESFNFMLPKDERPTMPSTPKKNPSQYFHEANQDPIELALNPDLLRLFISPTGRILPRRFTGLNAKNQRKITRAIKVCRQLALLPQLSRYPSPSPEQLQAITEEAVSRVYHFDDVEDNFDFEDDE